MTLVNDFTRKCLAIEVARALGERLTRLGRCNHYIECGLPWENGCCETFNGKLRDEGPSSEIFYGLKEA